MVFVRKWLRQDLVVFFLKRPEHDTDVLLRSRSHHTNLLVQSLLDSRVRPVGADAASTLCNDRYLYHSGCDQFVLVQENAPRRYKDQQQ